MIVIHHSLITDILQGLVVQNCVDADSRLKALYVGLCVSIRPLASKG